MLIACWSAKGGSGTTVVATALALLLADRSPGSVRVADLAGDVPAVLGLPRPTGPGLGEWLEAGDGVPADALGRLAIEAGPLTVLPCGEALASNDADGERLAAALTAGSSATIVDCGTLGVAQSAGRGVAAVAGLSLLVTRPCYLSLRRAVEMPIRPSGVIFVREKDRVVSRLDIEDVLEVPVRAVVNIDAAVARAVDAGMLAQRVPPLLGKALRRALT